jgi:hypothetical protein
MRMLFTCCKKVRRHRGPLSNTHTHARQAGGHSTEVCPLYRQPAQAVSLSPHRACSQGECQSSDGAATQRQQECRCRLCASCAERTLLARASISPPPGAPAGEAEALRGTSRIHGLHGPALVGQAAVFREYVEECSWRLHTGAMDAMCCVLRVSGRAGRR